ncbi:hypothetical protein SG34_007105 [Thalassomonas viridans]|uniref:Uncharacterized protein n=1 Tax=Thalassomonas viridans TaxID=137584 RepID=A0AAE9Z7E6_9GAMM|nr:hypothetical protein [Thalassomonas viridans]WDE06668.1 hypothetical protein SG34_007105 [Thalassomonas viridans]
MQRLKSQFNFFWDWLGYKLQHSRKREVEFFSYLSLLHHKLLMAETGQEIILIKRMLLDRLDLWGLKTYLYKVTPYVGLAVSDFFHTVKAQERYLYVEPTKETPVDKVDDHRKKVIYKAFHVILSLMPEALENEVTDLSARLLEEIELS